MKFFSTLIVLFAIFFEINAQIYNWAVECSWISDQANRPNPETVDFPKLKLWEECVFMNITKSYLQQYWGRSEPSSYTIYSNWRNVLESIRPRQEMKIRLHDSNITSFNLAEQSQQLYLGAQLVMSWIDDRLKWEPEKFGLTRIRLHTFRANEMWYPKIARNYLYALSYAVAGKDDFRMNIVPIIRSDGNVSMQTTISISQRTELDYSKYPYDKQNICIPQQLDTNFYSSEPQSESIEFEILNDIPLVSNENWYGSSAWKLTEPKLTPVKPAGVQLCFTMRRNQPAARIELIVPMILAALLAVAAPLFGSLQVQAIVKVLAMFFQYMCLQDLIAKTKDFPFGASLPQIMIFYEFLMITTMISLVINLLLWAFQRAPLSSPPPHSYAKFAEKVNGCFICTKFGERDESGLLESGESPSELKLNKTEWVDIIQATNNVAFVLFTVVYLTGIIVLCNF